MNAETTHSPPKTLITGGSGFIGTNLVAGLLAAGGEVLNLDVNEPQHPDHASVFRRVDILDPAALQAAFAEFAPEAVVHLAARTDLHEAQDINGYRANIEGVENLIRAIAEAGTVRRSIFTSTKLVCPTDHTPQSDDDYCPDTLYGESKVRGEKLVRESTALPGDWCIIRPTSIWGPWSMMPHIPYGRFFVAIARGRYLHPGRANPPRSFGYVGNGVFQIQRLLAAPRAAVHGKIFYLTDYEGYTIRDWADLISHKLRGKKIRQLPEPLVQLLAWGGDLLKVCGVKEPPFSSFRLRNMRADTSGAPLDTIRAIADPLPYSLERGVEETIAWLKAHHHIT